LEGPVHPRRGTVLRHDNDVDANNAEVLLEANLVTVPSSYIDHVPLVEGQAVIEQSAAERAREQRRRFVRMLALILLAVGIAVGVTLGITSNRPSPSPLPGTSIPNFRQLFDSLPNHTAQILRNVRSPQYLAWTWLATTEFNFDADVWQLRQRFALACFRFATDAFASYINSGPFSPLNLDECHWNGIVCQENGSVIQITLSDSDLSGSVPRELYFLSEMTALNLTGNDHLEGTLSSDIWLLDVSMNSMRGSIPTELALLSSLIQLDLSRNRMTGTLPTHLGQLSNLRRLILDGNQLSGPIPSDLGQFSSCLNWLDLSYNHFTGALPSELGQLTLLEHLDLGYDIHPLTGRIPTELGLLSKLTYLTFGSLTSFAGSIPTEFRTTHSVRVDCFCLFGTAPFPQNSANYRSSRL